MSRTGQSVVVVGGGTTGCISALRLADAGHHVVLLESSAALGGIMRDHVHDHTGFLRGCQYVEAGVPWLPLAMPVFEAHAVEVAHAMGSMTVIDDDVYVLDGMGVPALPGAIPAIGGGDARTLAERFAGYGAWAAPLTGFAARTGHEIDRLDASCALGLQLSRVYPRESDPVSLLAAKAASSLADARLAAKRLDRGVASPRSFVPSAGWAPLFDAMLPLLESRGVEVRLRATARAAVKEDRLRLHGDGIPNDAIVLWAANPVPLVRHFDAPRLDNAWMTATNLHVTVRGWSGPLPFYVQRFDAASPILRVYVYEWQGSVRGCIECCGTISLADAPTVVAKAAATCAPWSAYGRFDPVAADQHRRHFLVTARDAEVLARLESRMRAAGAIPGAWLAYGREQKLAAIADDARALDLLPAVTSLAA